MVANIQLSKDIWLYDYLKSAQAERFPAIKEQQYNLSPDLLKNAQRFALEVDQPIIDAWGFPINKTSTYRCPDFIKNGVHYRGLNTIVGGAESSAHCFLRAGDREPYVMGKEANGLQYKEFALMVMDVARWDSIIMEFGTQNCPAWIHIQISKSGSAPRREVYRVGEFTGRKYVPFDVHKWNPA